MRSGGFHRSLKFRRAVLAAVVGGLLAFATSAQADFGVKPGGFESRLLDEAGSVVDPSQAGAHPASQDVKFTLNTTHYDYPSSPSGQFPPSGPEPDPDGDIKTAITELPPGLIGDPQAVTLCQAADFPPVAGIGPSGCPTDSQIGIASLDISQLSGYPYPPEYNKAPVYNLAPPKGVIARIGFVATVPVISVSTPPLAISLRPPASTPPG